MNNFSLYTSWLLWMEFFKTGMFAVGGGLAAIPFLSEIGRKYGWYSQQQLINMIGISESTPGPLGVNMATFTGYNVMGVVGAAIATLGLAAPSVIIMVMLGRFMEKNSQSTLVQRAFLGLRPAVCAMVSAAFVSLAGVTLLQPAAGAPFGVVPFLPTLLIFAVIFALINVSKLENLHPVVILSAAAVAGILLKA